MQNSKISERMAQFVRLQKKALIARTFFEFQLSNRVVAVNQSSTGLERADQSREEFPIEIAKYNNKVAFLTAEVSRMLEIGPLQRE